MEKQYFELFIGSGPVADRIFWMCICGVRAPTVQEANQFYADDMARIEGRVLAVLTIDEKTARSWYDFDNEENWPVFGLRKLIGPCE